MAVCISASSSLSLRDTGNLPSKDEHLEGPHVIWQGCAQFEVYRDKSRDIKFYVLWMFDEQVSDPHNPGVLTDKKLCKNYRDTAVEQCPGEFGPDVGLYEPVCEKNFPNSNPTDWTRYPNVCLSFREWTKELISCDEPSVPTVAPVAHFYHNPSHHNPSYGNGGYGNGAGAYDGYNGYRK